MANYVGREGKLYINGIQIGDAYNFTGSANKERIEVTAFGDTSKSYLGGLADGSVSFDCYLNDSDSGQALLVEGTNVNIVLGIAGTYAAPCVSGLVYIDEVSYAAGVSDPVQVSVSCTGHVIYDPS